MFCSVENVPVRNSDVDYRLLEAAKAGDLDTVKVCHLLLEHLLDDMRMASVYTCEEPRNL